MCGGLLLTLSQLAGLVWAQQDPPKGVFIGRLQLAAQTDHVVRISESTYSANSEGLFFLQALDHNHDVETERGLLTRLQVYYGGPLPFKDMASPWGWVGRLEDVRTPDVRLADARWGLQLNINRLDTFSQWLRENQVDLFVQVFPLRTNRDFGTWDTFTRFSKRFAPKVVLRGYGRTFSMEGRTVATFENDLIYEVQRDFDVLFRVGKSSHDIPGIAEKRGMAGVGMRLNF